MNASTTFCLFVSRCREPVAGLLGALSLVFLWTGLGIPDLLPMSREAIAESSAQDQEIPLSKERAALLVSTVDSVALGMGGMFSGTGNGGPLPLADEEKKQAALSGALSALTFELGGEVYFTAWHGTSVIHAPASPDSVYMDFADALDSRGKTFVQSMERVARSGGGFISVSLPRQLLAKTDFTGLRPMPVSAEIPSSLFERQQSVVRGEIQSVDADAADILHIVPESCPLSSPGSCARMTAPSFSPPDMTPVEQIVYVRRIPNSNWHLAAFMPVGQGSSPQGFSSAWTANIETPALRAEELFRKGLCVSGISLAGLAGLLLTPARRREEDGAAMPSSAYWWDTRRHGVSGAGVSATEGKGGAGRA